MADNRCVMCGEIIPEGRCICPNCADFVNSKVSNNVNHPSHYTKGGIECIEAIKASMTREAFCGYCKGNILKYIWRYEDKGQAEDLKKARVYLDWMISEVDA